jgi:hypothetical protein
LFWFWTNNKHLMYRSLLQPHSYFLCDLKHFFPSSSGPISQSILWGVRHGVRMPGL